MWTEQSVLTEKRTESRTEYRGLQGGRGLGLRPKSNQRLEIEKTGRWVSESQGESVQREGGFISVQ